MLYHNDILGYKHLHVEYSVSMMCNIYKVLGFILPYSTRAKIPVRHFLDKLK